jgi:signal transduction histidine kinase
MTDDVKVRIYDPFFTTKPVGEGTGLGMAIVYGIIQDHKGDIHVESSPGVGTEFTIDLPVRHQRATQQRA